MAITEAVKMVAELMAVAARTAPKAVGQDFIEIKVLTDSEKVALGSDMIQVGKERGIWGFERDGQNVLDSDAVVLIGLLAHKGAGLNCSACGFASCEEFNTKSCSGDFEGPNCAIRLLDLGIAIGSAAKLASELNVDNRVMYRVGVSAKRLGLGNSRIIHGIPLSATGKNIFFDRPKK
ncbi:MAG: ferredoxin domain-containing protein [Thermoplasmata archaeon]